MLHYKLIKCYSVPTVVAVFKRAKGGNKYQVVNKEENILELTKTKVSSHL